LYSQYIDDILILIASQDETQHKEYLKILFNRLQQHDIAIRINVFGQTFWDIQSALKNQIFTEKVQAIAEFQEPATIKELNGSFMRLSILRNAQFL